MNPERLRVLSVVLAVPLALAALAGVGIGLYAVADDLRVRTDDWDGFGVFFGLILAVPSFVVLGLLVAGLALLGRPGRLGYGLVLAASLVAFVTLFAFGMIAWWAQLAAVPTLALVVVALLGLGQGGRRTPAARVAV